MQGPAAAQLQIENRPPFLGIWQLQQEDLVEATFAQQFGGQPFDRIGGGYHKHRAGFFAHPGEQAGQHPLAGATVAAAITAKALVNLIDPEHAGGHGLGPLNHVPGTRFTGPHQPGKQPSHIKAQQGHVPAVGDGLGGKGFASALGTH